MKAHNNCGIDDDQLAVVASFRVKIKKYWSLKDTHEEHIHRRDTWALWDPIHKWERTSTAFIKKDRNSSFKLRSYGVICCGPLSLSTTVRIAPNKLSRSTPLPRLSFASTEMRYLRASVTNSFDIDGLIPCFFLFSNGCQVRLRMVWWSL